MHTSPDEHNNFSIDRFESMLKTNNVLFFDSEEFEDIVNYYLENGKIALAKKATKLGLKQHPSSTNLKLYQIEIFIFEDKLEKAEGLLDDIFLLEQSNSEIFIQKANILSRRNKHKEAIETLEKALELDHTPSDVLSLIGMEYLFMEDYENGMQYFMKCLEEDEEDYSALYNIIYCLEFLGKSDDAINFLNDFLEKQPYCEVAWHEIAKQYRQRKEYDKALSAIDFAIISDDTFLGAYFEKAKILEKVKRYHEAIECYSITLTIDDPTSFALLRIGKCHERLGNNELALEFYSKSIKEDNLRDQAWIAIIDLHYKNKQYNKALYYIEKAIAIDSTNVHYWKRYAKTNNKINHFEEAEVGYRKALELGNYELSSWLTRGDILTNLGEYEAAINNFNQAMEFYPSHPEIEYRLSGLYFSMKQSDKGEYHLNNALKTEPEFVMIIEEIFPHVYRMKKVKQIIAQHKNPSL